jgi:hypothetical protein
MKVICIKESKRFIKGLEYEVLILRNSSSRFNYISVKGMSRYSVNNFTDMNGKELPKIDYTAPVEKNEIEFEDLNKGDYIKCNVDNYKSLIKGNLYRVESAVATSQDIKSSSGSVHTYYNKYVKFEGVQRRLKFNKYSFAPLTTSEKRDLNLNSVLNNEEFEVIDMKKNRKIDLMRNKDEELLKIMSKSILDPTRHHLSILEWGFKLTNLDIVKEDYDHLMNLSLKEILEKLEKVNK